jgi:large subunit ribosomal protein L21
MAKIAVIKTGGKQYKVSEGQTLNVEKLATEVGAKLNLDTLLMADADGQEINIGQPSLGDKVEAKVLEQGKAKKVSVIKFKSKTHYKKNVGHRQPFTKIEITKIS